MARRYTRDACQDRFVVFVVAFECREVPVAGNDVPPHVYREGRWNDVDAVANRVLCPSGRGSLTCV